MWKNTYVHIHLCELSEWHFYHPETQKLCIQIMRIQVYKTNIIILIEFIISLYPDQFKSNIDKNTQRIPCQRYRFCNSAEFYSYIVLLKKLRKISAILNAHKRVGILLLSYLNVITIILVKLNYIFLVCDFILYVYTFLDTNFLLVWMTKIN